MKLTAFWLLFGLLALKGFAASQEQTVSGTKIPSTVIIILTHEFCTAEVRIGNSLAGYEVLQPGRLLCPSAEEVARNSFERVIRMETAPRPQDAGGHLVLIPRFADMEATRPVIKKRNVALLLEWSAVDPSGKILWVQTVEGDAQKGGNSHQKMFELLMHDLVVKSTEAIKGSQEIRQFVERSQEN